MRKRSAIVIAADAALAASSSASAGHDGRIAFERFDPRIGNRIYSIRLDGTGPHAITRPPKGAEWL
jgi:hypothetical protein